MLHEDVFLFQPTLFYFIGHTHTHHPHRVCSLCLARGTALDFSVIILLFHLFYSSAKSIFLQPNVFLPHSCGHQPFFRLINIDNHFYPKEQYCFKKQTNQKQLTIHFTRRVRDIEWAKKILTNIVLLVSNEANMFQRPWNSLLHFFFNKHFFILLLISSLFVYFFFYFFNLFMMRWLF